MHIYHCFEQVLLDFEMKIIFILLVDLYQFSALIVTSLLQQHDIPLRIMLSSPTKKSFFIVLLPLATIYSDYTGAVIKRATHHVVAEL